MDNRKVKQDGYNVKVDFTTRTLDIQVQSKITHGIIIVSTVFFFREDFDDACLMMKNQTRRLV
jgi:hypothetical protein